jgi:hypothetical protein
LDDLGAANRFKSFLIGSGVEVAKEVTEGLANLVSAFSEELDAFERKVREQESGVRSKRRFIWTGR